MMALGIVLHAANAYWVVPSPLWPYDDPQEHIVADLLVMVIHTFRMPTFFLMAGFFAALLLERRGVVPMLRNRFMRVVVPFLVFWPLLVPLVFAGGTFASAHVESDIGVAARSAWAQLVSGAGYRDSTIHLWFLYDLALFYGFAVTSSALFKRLPIVSTQFRALFRWALTSKGAVLWFALPTAVSFIPMHTGTFDTHASFAPAVRELCAYGLIFGYGWTLYGERDLLAAFSRSPWLNLILGGLAFFTWRAVAEQGSSLEPLALLLSALTTWLLVFAMTGLFLRYLGRYSAVGRYFSDASYWVYLVHLPLVLWVAGLLAQWQVSALVKLVVVVVTATGLSLATYYAFVRSTAIGALLNGRRYGRGLPP